MKNFKVYFRGESEHGDLVEAPTMKEAKLLFAKKIAERDGIQYTKEQYEAQLYYICARKGITHGKR